MPAKDSGAERALEDGLSAARDASLQRQGSIMLGHDIPMAEFVVIGQKWSVWNSSRRQWLLATVTDRSDGKFTLKCDRGYGMASGEDLVRAEEADMLSTSNRFRFIAC